MKDTIEIEKQISELEKQVKNKKFFAYTDEPMTEQPMETTLEPETPEQEANEYQVASLLSPELKDGLNSAIVQELFQSNLWKSLANQMQRQGFFGTQKYFLKESVEELGHYQMIVDFMNDLGDMATVPALDMPMAEAEEIGDALVIAYNKEVEVYNFYKALYAMAMVEDVVVAQFLLQFLQIQKEAVGAYGDLISTYRTANATGEILEFDETMGE